MPQVPVTYLLECVSEAQYQLVKTWAQTNWAQSQPVFDDQNRTVRLPVAAEVEESFFV